MIFRKEVVRVPEAIGHPLVTLMRLFTPSSRLVCIWKRALARIPFKALGKTLQRGQPALLCMP